MLILMMPSEAEPRLVVPEKPVLAGEEIEVAVVVGEPPRYIATEQVASLCTDDPHGGGREFRLWAGSASDGPGWAALEGPWLEGGGRLQRPSTFRIPDVLASGRCWVEVSWVREDLLEPAAGQAVSGTTRGTIEVVGPTAPLAAVEEAPSLELDGDPVVGGELKGTVVGTVRGRLPLLEGVAVLEHREPQRWQRVATLFAGRGGRPPHWLPAGKGWFGYGPGTAGEQLFQIPPDLPPGEYRVAVRYRADPPAVEDAEARDSVPGRAPLTKAWYGLLRSIVRIDGRLD